MLLKTNNYKLQPNKGFSLIEVLVVIAIFVAIAALAIAPFRFLKKEGALNSVTENAVSFLIEARTKTLSSEDEARYGVHFNTDNITLFKGSVFNESSPDNKVSTLPSSVERSAISLNGGGRDIVFERLTGETNEYGTVVFRLKTDIESSRTLRIEETGIINVE